MWKKINEYYWEKEGWTITKYLTPGKEYALWKGNKNKGWFDSREEANEDYKRLNKCNLP